jgi:LAO/AO transport system kinase
VTRAQWRNALHLLRPASSHWTPPVLALSALHKAGIADFWAEVERYQAALRPTGEFAARRQRQALAWMWELIDAGLREHFHEHPRVRENLPALTRSVEKGETTPDAAANTLLGYLKQYQAEESGL